MEPRVSSVSLRFCLLLLPAHLSLTVIACVCRLLARHRAIQQSVILWFVFKGCCWVTATLLLCLGELWISINQWHTVSQLPDWLQWLTVYLLVGTHSHKNCFLTDSTKVSLFLSFLFKALLSSHLSDCFPLLYSLLSLFKSKQPNLHVSTHYCMNSN